MIKFWKKSLLVQIVGSFSLLSLVIVTLVGYTAFSQARELLKQSVFERLIAIASLKEEELNYWLSDRRKTLIALSQLPEIRTQAKILFTAKPSSRDYQKALDILQTSLSIFIGDRADYEEIFLLSRTSRVLISTNPQKMGQYEPIFHSSEVIIGQQDNFVANFYRSSDNNLPAVTFTISLLDETGQRLGMLGVDLNLDRIDQIIRNNRGLGTTGESYLVADLGSSVANHYTFVSPQGFGSVEFPDGIESPGIQAAMAGNDDRGLYLNYRGTPVIGVYRWLETQDVALLTEMEQLEALAPSHQLAYSIVLVGLGLAGIMTMGILMLSRQIVKPILAISETARSLGTKVKENEFFDLEIAPVLTENEIGILAQTFNQMTAQLQHSYVQLQEYSHTLEAQVSARTWQLRDKNKHLKLTLKELKQTQMQLIQNEKMASLGQMVAGIAHEINNPVNFIHANLQPLDEYIMNLLNLIQLYENHYLDDPPTIIEEKEYIDFDFLKTDLPKLLNSMKIGTTRIQEIVIGLRNFSRLDESDRKMADLHEGIDSTLLILQNRLKAHGNRPEIQVIKEYGELPKVECYPGQLNQVFLNLIGNAIDALELGIVTGETEIPTICIRTILEEDQIIISLADNGPGMDEETCQKIFDPFFTTKAIGKGTGLGLSISYSIIVERHSGELKCISAPGQGAEFIIAISM